MISLAFLLAVTPSVTNAAASEVSYPLVTYKCNVEDDIISITNSLLPDDEGPTFKYSDENGTYSPWDLVEKAKDLHTLVSYVQKKSSNTAH